MCHRYDFSLSFPDLMQCESYVQYSQYAWILCTRNDPSWNITTHNMETAKSGCKKTSDGFSTFFCKLLRHAMDGVSGNICNKLVSYFSSSAHCNSIWHFLLIKFMVFNTLHSFYMDFTAIEMPTISTIDRMGFC